MSMMTGTYPNAQPKLQHIINPITKWPTQDLVTLSELKIQLRIPDTDTTRDPELNLIIDGVSAQMGKMANRDWGFGFNEVNEIFFNAVDEDRLYFSVWPVKSTDISKMELNGVNVLGDEGINWVLEEETGTLFRPFDPWNGTLNVTYSGGYKIPAETPDDLKRAAAVAMRDDYYTYIRGTVLSGVRMISHKHARVMYYPPGQLSATQGQGGPSTMGPIWTAVWNVLNKYIRHWM